MKKTNKRGFTLIEVVLVLAIGGLIFLLAFLAFQNASKNRRDTQRRTDAGKVLAEISNAISDGVEPPFTGTGTTGKQTKFKVYIAGIQNPAKQSYNVGFRGTSGSGTLNLTPTSNTLYVATGAKCDGNDAFITSTSNNAVIVSLEKGSACVDDE